MRSASRDSARAASDAAGFVSVGPSLTQQSFKADADINTIVDRFLKHGTLPEDARSPSYGDFSGISSYHDALNTVIQANAMFDALPSKVRARFKNDPGLYVDFFKDPQNLQEAVNFGLVNVRPSDTSPRPSSGAVGDESEDSTPKAAKSSKASKKPVSDEGE